jgi:hypothetical protein
MENEIEKEIRTIIPILARRCGVFDEDILEVMYKISDEEHKKHFLDKSKLFIRQNHE